MIAYTYDPIRYMLGRNISPSSTMLMTNIIVKQFLIAYDFFDKYNIIEMTPKLWRDSEKYEDTPTGYYHLNRLWSIMNGASTKSWVESSQTHPSWKLHLQRLHHKCHALKEESSLSRWLIISCPSPIQKKINKIYGGLYHLQVKDLVHFQFF